MPKLIRLELSQADRDELERRRRTRTIAHREHERLAMIRAVADGATIPQAARALGVHEQPVRAFVARFAAEGFAGLAPGGRPA